MILTNYNDFLKTQISYLTILIALNINIFHNRSSLKFFVSRERELSQEILAALLIVSTCLYANFATLCLNVTSLLLSRRNVYFYFCKSKNCTFFLHLDYFVVTRICIIKLACSHNESKSTLLDTFFRLFYFVSESHNFTS